jgi:DNA-binding NtrC family response regulator
MKRAITSFPVPDSQARVRGDDVMLLAESFLDDIARARGVGPFTLAPRAAGALRGHQWPGNARELGNVLERATVTWAARPSRRRICRFDPPPVSYRNSNSLDLNNVERSTIERVMRDMERQHL